MFIQQQSLHGLSVKVTYDVGYIHPVNLSFCIDGEFIIRACLTPDEARAISQQLLAACDAEPITPIGDFQDSTPNNI